MKIGRILSFLLLLFGIAAIADEKSCYTVQLMSAPKKSSEVERFSKKIHDPACQLMTIGDYATVRCGCYEKYKEARVHYRLYKKRYKYAAIARSYAFRFKQQGDLKNRSEENIDKTKTAHAAEKGSSSLSGGCYTVQLWSVPVSQKNFVNFDLLDRRFGCKEMRIGNHVTVRCGCFNEYKKAKRVSRILKKRYRKAIVTRSYAYRFYDEDRKNSPSLEVAAQDEPIAVTMEGEEKGPFELSSSDYDEAFTKVGEGREIGTDIDEEIDEREPIISYKLVKKSKVPVHYDYERYLRPFRGYRNAWWGYRYRFGARMSYDLGYVDEADYKSFEYGFRRVRFYHRGSFFNRRLFYKAAFSFTGNNHVKDLYIGWRDRYRKSGFRYRLKVGNIKIPQSLEGYTSSKYLTFMERSLGDAYAENRRLGLEARLSQRFVHHYFTLFGDYYNSSVDEKLEGEDIDHPTLSARAHYVYRWNSRRLLMAGGSVATQDHNGDKLRLKEGAESVLDSHKYVHVKIRDVDTIDKYHVDALYLYRRFSVQGGYTTLKIDSKKGLYNFHGYYLQASYFIRGEGKDFDPINGKFKRIRPVYGGDIEAALRFSYIDLNDKDEHGGSQSDYTMALNWYLNPNTRLMFNYILAFPDDTDLYDGMYQIIQSRILFSF